jgi:GMP synthase (glutamine-hydrolysing)
MALDGSVPSTGRVAVLDFGGQYVQLIARRVRECRVYCEILPPDVPPGELRAGGFAAAILSGGPASVYGDGAPRAHPELVRSGLPLLGICYGHQLLAHELGGRVVRAERAEYGGAELEVLVADGVLAGLPARTPVWMSHGDLVLEPPPGLVTLARTASTPVAAMGDPRRRIYGVQFHPEVAHTPLGERVLRNFLFGVAGLAPTWTMGSYADRAVAEIRSTVGEGRAISALSGGVDSAVATALVYRAIGDRLTAIFVDHGLGREGEAEEVVSAFARAFPGLRLVHVQAGERFLRALRGVTDPEQKRRIVGSEFVSVFEEEARRLGPVEFLVQGTIYPDVIESGQSRAGKAAVIKTHHNVGGLPARMRLRLIEPLRPLFKDEVRALGEELGLDPQLLWRQPFPGPGLAIRILGEVTPERLAILRRADRIVREELAPHGLGREIWQAFAVLPGARTVGVQGDERSYGELVAVRAIASRDGMTADWARLPHELLARISTRITNEVPGVNRVVYDITSKPPATIEWE